MININLDKEFLIIENEEKKAIMADIMSNILFTGIQLRNGATEIHNTNIVKIYNWSMSLKEKKEISLDSEDLKNILIPFVNNEPSLKLGIKAQLLIELEKYKNEV